jgi:hypothetical protein
MKCRCMRISSEGTVRYQTSEAESVTQSSESAYSSWQPRPSLLADLVRFFSWSSWVPLMKRWP